MRLVSLAIFPFEIAEVAGDLFVAIGKRSRHAAVGDQEIGDIRWLQFRVIDPAIGTVRRDRAQDRFPLHIVHRRADGGDCRQEHVVFHVEDAGGVVGPFDEGADAREVEDLVPEHRAVEGTTDEAGAALDRIDDLGHVGRTGLPGEDRLHFEVAFVRRFPGLARQRRADHASVVAARLDAGHHARRIGPVAQQEVDRVDARQRLVHFVVEFAHAGTLQHAVPVTLRRLAAGQRHAQAGIDQPGAVFGAFDVAEHPVETVCSSSQHGLSPPVPRCPWSRHPGWSSRRANQP
ncbi:hypothetical protein D9M72_360710 [compost metagenome]